MSKEKTGYADMIAELEAVIEKLSQNDLALEESLRLYEKGIKIYGECNKKLSDAEAKLLKIKENAQLQPLILEEN